MAQEAGHHRGSGNTRAICISRQWSLVILCLSLLLYVCILQVDMRFLSSYTTLMYVTTPNNEPTTPSSASCPAQEKGYRSIFCPVWPHDKLPIMESGAYVSKHDLPPEVAPLVRYLYGAQNPEDCTKAKYYFKEYYQDVGKCACMLTLCYLE